MRRRHFGLSLLSLALLGCDEALADELCIGVGFCAGPPPPPAIEVVVVVDATPGSTGSLATLERVVDTALDTVEERPDSVVSVWTVGEDASTCREVSSVAVPVPPTRLRARRAYFDRTRGELRAVLVAPVVPLLDAAASYGRSEIALTLTLAGRTPRRAATRTFILVSDLRENSRPGIDVECSVALPERRFRRSLERRGLLGAGTFSLEDSVELLDLGALPEIPGRRRCPTSLRRAEELRELWRPALEAAGARVSAPVGSPTFELPSE